MPNNSGINANERAFYGEAAARYLAGYTSNTGTVTSVALSVPTGLSMSGSPVTTAGTFILTYAAGYQGYTSAESLKLGGIAAGSQVNVVTSVFGRTGVITPASGDYTFAQIGSKPTTLTGYGIADAATAAQGTLATNAMPKSGGAFNGTVTSSGTLSALNLSGTNTGDQNLAPYALDVSVMHLAGVETVTGAKTFNANVALGAGVSINMPNGGTLASWVGGSYIKTGSGGGTVFVGSTSSAANALAILDSSAVVQCLWDHTGAMTQSQTATFSKTVATGGFTVATLPAGTIGMRAYVTDALTPSFGAALVGGGTVVTPAFYNGTTWIDA